jgi:hypothetical protein
VEQMTVLLHQDAVGVRDGDGASSRRPGPGPTGQMAPPLRVSA